MHFAFGFLNAVPDPPLASAPLLGAQGWWLENVLIRHEFAAFFDALGAKATSTLSEDLVAAPQAKRDQVHAFLGLVPHPLAKQIQAQLGSGSGSSSSRPAVLTGFGRFWSDEDRRPLVIEPQSWRDALEQAVRLHRKPPVRPLLVTGEAMVGKSSFLGLLAARLGREGWQVFEAGGSDLQAGQKYIGELEERIRQSIAALDAGKKIVWYVPDLLQLATSGTHGGQSATILDQIVPALSLGRLILWSEASPKSAVRLMQLRPGLRRMFEIIQLESMSDEETGALGKALAKDLGQQLKLTIEPGVADTALDTAKHYMSTSGLPGAALSLIKLTALRAEPGRSKAIVGRDVLEAVSQLTGLPLGILDPTERLDLAALRSEFAARVLGQPEAVGSMVERIAMLKSGLNDPGKPIGVFLFAGPTGTGKTELAKAVATYLFGSTERMVRLDMSEFQTPDTVAKILGGAGLPGEADTLITRIRKQPFSLVLLDEFEKAAPQIWDLFLQVFDEGRLTDGFGQTADFRHCIIILTSNLGATAHRNSGLGFSPGRAEFEEEQVLRMIGQTFRPEFQNRLDRVIVFRPLTRDLMRGILKKELGLVLERRGLKDRDWAVEWEASALEFLLERGFSPEMGARPLKRAIDQYLVTPLAEAIVERRLPEGEQFVFVRRDGDALKADFVDPDGGAEEAAGTGGAVPPAARSVAELIRTQTGVAGEIATVAGAVQMSTQQLAAPDWSERKQRLTAEMSEAGFWTSPGRFKTLSEIELMDRLEVAADTATSMLGRLRNNPPKDAGKLRPLIGRCALQAHLLASGLEDLRIGAPVDAALLIEPAFQPSTEEAERVQAWRRVVEGMYAAWADARNMKSQRLDGVPIAGSSVLVVSGFGAYRTLGAEQGLHVLEGDDLGSTRIAVRALVVEPPPERLSKSELRQALCLSFGKIARPAQIVRRYRRSPAPLVRSGDGAVRSGRLDEVLAGNFDLALAEPV
jgi:ATP-dependent Clp protease ATP-binding subunit ClpC